MQKRFSIVSRALNFADVNLPTGSENSTEMKTITRGDSIFETLKELKVPLTASKIEIPMQSTSLKTTTIR